MHLQFHGLHSASRISEMIKQNYCSVLLLGKKNNASEIHTYSELYLLGFMSICSSAKLVCS